MILIAGFTLNNQNIYDEFRKVVKATADECKFYQQLCLAKEFDFNQRLTEESLDQIPWVNWAYFKQSHQKFPELLRIPIDKLNYWTLSSSTSGDPSVIGRNQADIEVFKQNYVKGMEDFSKIKVMNDIILFAPPTNFLRKLPWQFNGKRGYLFVSDIFSAIANYNLTFLIKFKLAKTILYTITHLKLKAIIELEGKKLENKLRETEKEKTNCMLANSAPLIYQNCHDLIRKYKTGFNMPETFSIFTGGGGWDGTKGRIKLGFKINKAKFIEEISGFFNIPVQNFTDLFGATETPLAAGGHWSKAHEDFLLHVDKKQGYIIARSVDNLEKIRKTKEQGILEVLTPCGVQSYAGIAVLLDDLVEIVDFNRCSECGRENVIVFKVMGRLTPDIGKGCSSLLNLYPFKD